MKKRWERILEVLENALERGQDERASYLARECGGDDTLQEEVLSLLAADEAAGAFLAGRPALPAVTLGSGADAPALAIGAVVDGRYSIEACLGRGGMGEVYRARQLQLDRCVALKVLRSDISPDAHALERFRREALAIGRLKHPHIVDVYDFNVAADGCAYLVMEYVNGRSLGQELRGSGPFSVPYAVDLIRQVCGAVHAAHTHGVVHRDLKPDNILLEVSEGHAVAKVLDFGIASLQNIQPTSNAVLTMAGCLIGTPAYMSPEQCNGQAADARSDVYSLGCVLYEMLTGRPPFTAPTLVELILKHVSEAPLPPSRHAPDVPAEVEAVVLRALAKRPEARFQTAAGFAHALAALAAAPPRATGRVHAGVSRFSGRSTALLDPGGVRTAEAPNNLPQQVTCFVGRERDIAALSQQLRAARLLTLTGPGGIGKTRLALQVVFEALDAYPDGAQFVELAALTDATLIPQAIASGLGVREEANEPILDALCRYLQPKRMLLVLDNCEHIVESSAAVAATLLRACPDLRVLATSRETFNITGEVTYRVTALSLPGEEHSGDPEALLRYDAVQLFVDRVRSNKPAFRLTAENAPMVARLCRTLEGIPLAIELAAARVKALSLEQILARLDDRFRLLTTGDRTAQPKQQTLRATMDWSYCLLSDEERALLRRLSVFAGGWTLEAAEAVCWDGGSGTVDRGGADAPADGPGDVAPRSPQDVRALAPDPSPGPLAGDQILDLLARLVDKSLVTVDEQEPDVRYRLLETIRQYGEEKLRESGERARVRARHTDWFLAFAERARAELAGPAQSEWLARLEAEHDNLRAVLLWSRAPEGDHQVGLRMCNALTRFWQVHGHYGEGRLWLEGLLSAEGDARVSSLRAGALDGAGVLAWNQGDLEGARARYEASLALRRQLGDRQGIAKTLHNLGVVMRGLGEYERATALYQESLELNRELGNERGVAASMNSLGTVAFGRKDYPETVRWFDESLALFRKLGDKRGIAATLHNFGELAQRRGAYGGARRLLEESLSIARELGDKGLTAASLHVLGNVANDEGEYERATSLFREVLGLHRELGDREGPAYILEGVACTAARSDPARALRLAGAAEKLREALGAQLSPAEQEYLDQYLGPARDALGAEGAARAIEEGRALGVEQALEYALGGEGHRPS